MFFSFLKNNELYSAIKLNKVFGLLYCTSMKKMFADCDKTSAKKNIYFKIKAAFIIGVLCNIL